MVTARLLLVIEFGLKTKNVNGVHTLFAITVQYIYGEYFFGNLFSFFFNWIHIK